MKTKITFLAILCVFAFAKAQTVSTILDGNFTDGLGMDSQGNIYGSEFGGDTVFKYDTNGTVTEFASGFINPNGIAVNDQNQIFICDHAIGGEGIIYKYDQDGTELDTFGGLTTPSGIQPIPGTNDMLFVEYNTSTVNRLSEDGTVTLLYDDGLPMNGPAGVVFIDGEAYIANFNDRRIYRFDLDTNTPVFIAELPSIGPANLDFLGFLSAKNGLLIATHLGGHQIFTIEPATGTVTSIAGSTIGSTDGDIDTARFNLPNGILGDDTTDRIYVSDAGTSNLRIIDDAVLGIDAFTSDLQIQITPNPTKDILSITGQLANAQNYSVKVFDIQGRLISQIKETAEGGQIRTSIDSNSWKAGTYLVQITASNRSITKKIIK